MNAVFCHDNIYISANGTIYSEGQFASSVWERYFKVFDHLTVVGRVRYVTNNEDCTKYNIAQRDDVDFAFIPNLAGFKDQLRNRKNAKKKLYEIIKNKDVVIIRGAGEIAYLAFTIAKQLGKTIAVEVVGCAWDSLWNYGSLKGKLYAPFSYIRTKYMVKNTPFAIYVSQNFLQSRYPNNGITAAASNVQIEMPQDSVLTKRIERINSKNETITIGTIASLKHNYKGLHIALKALAEIKEDIPPFEFQVLGNGDPSKWQDLTQQLGLQKYVKFVGILPSGDLVLHWLDNIDIYLQPSFQEGVPRATIEALSRGCPALGSTAGGIPELLKKDYLHKPGDFETLSKQIKNTIESIAVQKQMAKENFELSKKYSSDVLSVKRYEFWTKVAQNAKKRQGV